MIAPIGQTNPENISIGNSASTLPWKNQLTCYRVVGSSIKYTIHRAHVSCNMQWVSGLFNVGVVG